MVFYMIMVLSYLLAFLSKENAVILPALILLYHYTFKEKIRFREFFSISAITLVYILVRATVLKHLIAGVIPNGAFLQRIPGFFVAVATYARLMFLPFGLHMEYGKGIFSFTDPRAISGLAILAGLIFCIYKTTKTNRLIFFSLSWFLITLLPVSNLYPLNFYMTEHWLYLPSIGFFLILAGSLNALYKKEKYRIPAFILAACLLISYSYLTIRQNQTWRDPALFYERNLKYAPDSPKIHNNLGLVYYNMGKKEEAIAMYRKEIDINPDSANAYNNLGVAYYDMGRKEEAIAAYKKAIEAKPDSIEAYINLVSIYHNMGRKEEAIPLYKKAIALNPGYFDAYNNLGIAYIKMGKREDAIAAFKKALEINPDRADTRRNLETLNR